MSLPPTLVDRDPEEPDHYEPETQGVRIPVPRSPFESTFDSYGSSSGFAGYITGGGDFQRPRSESLSMRFRQAGGVNSIDNFARSWQRAAGFPEVLPRRSSFLTADSDEEWLTAANEVADAQGSRLFRPEIDETRPLLTPERETEAGNLPNDNDNPSRKSVLGTSFDRSLGTSYGTISSRVSEATRRNVTQFHREHQAHIDVPLDGNIEPLSVKSIQHEDGTKSNVVVGQSTVPQTIFNSVNVLIGVGLLSLPLAMKQAGWLFGLLFLLFAAVTTSYTAKILAKCLDIDRSLVTCRPLVATVEVLCGLEPHPHAISNRSEGVRAMALQSFKAMIRVVVLAAVVLMAILFPSFDRIMALMGSALCFTICVILPLAFYLKIFGHEISPRERVLDWCLLILSSMLAIIGTAWAFLPQDMIST
ncbi:putative transporter [Aspergillus affinis]|uniref:putative transporter n=1 Tax=Aspergillus affinis TaxID=1070780 RepID=UPI0022FF1D02|nr:transporter [Aspergillus affinis]KAI9037373.1 transporter [Aspergillus affinis]